VLSPIDLLARAVPIQHHSLAALALKILIGFEGVWLLVRRLGASRAAACLAGAAFAWGGAVMPWALYPIATTLVWVPWLIAGTICVVRRPTSRAIAATAALCAFVLLSGHPETAAIGGLLAVVCGLSLGKRGRRWRGVGAASLTALLGLGLAAPVVLPFVSVLPETQRAQETTAASLPEHRVDPWRPATWFVPGYPAFLLSPTNPHAFGKPFAGSFTGPFHWLEASCGYAGLVVFAGAAVAAVSPRRRRAAPFLWFAVLSLLVTARFLPLAHLFAAVPWLRVAASARFLSVGCLALTVAGAAGIDALLRRSPRPAPAWLALLGAAALSLAVETDGWVLLLWLLLAVAAGLARGCRRSAAVALGGVLLLDLGAWSPRFLPTGDPALFYPRTPLVELVAEEAGDPQTGRAAGALHLLYPSLLPAYGVAEARPHNPMAPARQLDVLAAAFGFAPSSANYFASFSGVDHPLLDFLNVRVVVGSIGLPPPSTLTRIDGDRFDPYQVYRNPDALPRWFTTGCVEAVSRGALPAWIAGLTRPDCVALDPGEASAWRPAPAVPVILLASRPGRVRLDVDGKGDRLLVGSVPHAPGWRARGDGRALPLLTVNGAFLGVRVPDGVTRVDLRFVPAGLVPGLGIALLSSVLGVGLWLRGQRARWPREPS
jgi:hypothetical protein